MIEAGGAVGEEGTEVYKQPFLVRERSIKNYVNDYSTRRTQVRSHNSNKEEPSLMFNIANSVYLIRSLKRRDEEQRR